MHLSAGTAPFYRDVMESFVSLLSLTLISAAERMGRRGHLHVKDKRDKNCRSEAKKKSREGDKVGGG